MSNINWFDNLFDVFFLFICLFCFRINCEKWAADSLQWRCSEYCDSSNHKKLKSLFRLSSNKTSQPAFLVLCGNRGLPQKGTISKFPSTLARLRRRQISLSIQTTKTNTAHKLHMQHSWKDGKWASCLVSRWEWIIGQTTMWLSRESINCWSPNTFRNFYPWCIYSKSAFRWCFLWFTKDIRSCMIWDYEGTCPFYWYFF